MRGPSSTPITPLKGSLLHAGPQSVPVALGYYDAPSGSHLLHDLVTLSVAGHQYLTYSRTRNWLQTTARIEDENHGAPVTEFAIAALFVITMKAPGIMIFAIRFPRSERD